jgi:hypothetical protein
VTANTSVQNGPIFSDERIRNALRRQIDRAINVDRDTTRAQLAADSRVSIHAIDGILTQDRAKWRRVATEDAFSLAYTLGDEAVQALLAVMGFSARRLDEAETVQPMLMAARAMSGLSVIATAAADGRIDHTEAPACREAADLIIATVLPLSSAGGAA